MTLAAPGRAREKDAMAQDPLARLDRLVGSWITEATHPAMPGVVVHGTVDISWLEGKRFLLHRARTDRGNEARQAGAQYPSSLLSS